MEKLNKERVLKIKKIIDENTTKEIQLKTKKEEEHKRAKKDYDCSTIEEIESTVDELDSNITEVEEQIKEKGIKLEAAYSWDL